MITYFIRVNCEWIKVTTSVAKWAATPRAVVLSGCKLIPVLVASGMTGGSTLPPHPPYSRPQIALTSPFIPSEYKVTTAPEYTEINSFGGSFDNVGGNYFFPMSASADGIPPSRPDIVLPVTNVPEPGSFLVFGQAIIALIFLRSRRRTT
jgi:hypothetical protein